MKPKVYCKTTNKGVHSFFIKTDSGEKYLFNQAYRRGVNKCFSNGVAINQLFDSKNLHDKAVRKTKDKLISSIRYIQKEYGIKMLRANDKKVQKAKRQTLCTTHDDMFFSVA